MKVQVLVPLLILGLTMLGEDALSAASRLSLAGNGETPPTAPLNASNLPTGLPAGSGDQLAAPAGAGTAGVDNHAGAPLAEPTPAPAGADTPLAEPTPAPAGAGAPWADAMPAAPTAPGAASVCAAPACVPVLMRTYDEELQPLMPVLGAHSGDSRAWVAP